MQTKQQIKQLLTSAGLRPNKRFGQHFLIDLNLMRLLVDAAGIRSSDIVLEVGCGTGSLTEALAERAGRTIAVEIDHNIARIAKHQLAELQNVTVINTDVLESKNRISHIVTREIEDAAAEFPGRLLLVANLPYSAAASVMLNLIAGPIVAESMCVTVQKEVADRMTAAPGSPDYGVLSIFMAATGQIKTLRTLRPSVFWPTPQVNSAMVTFTRNQEKVRRIHDIELFKEVVNLFMGHRRKMLKACVKFARNRLLDVGNWHDIFARAFVELHHRGEELSAEDYIAITNLCYESLHS